MTLSPVAFQIFFLSLVSTSLYIDEPGATFFGCLFWCHLVYQFVYWWAWGDLLWLCLLVYWASWIYLLSWKPFKHDFFKSFSFCSFSSSFSFLNSQRWSIAYRLLGILPWVSKILLIFHSFFSVFFGLGNFYGLLFHFAAFPGRSFEHNHWILFQLENFYLVLFILFISSFRFPACSLFNTKIPFNSFHIF